MFGFINSLVNTMNHYWQIPAARHASVVSLCMYVWLKCTRAGEMVMIKGLFSHISVWMESLLYMVLSKDTKGLGVKYQIPGSKADPAHVAKRLNETTKKRIIFLRHGESDWNSVFNKGKNIGMLFRLFKAIVTEWTMIFRLDSPFLDSPLNEEGIEQALELRKYVACLSIYLPINIYRLHYLEIASYNKTWHESNHHPLPSINQSINPHYAH